MSDALRSALAGIRKAENDAFEQMKRDYPIDSLIDWDHKHRGRVLGHGMGMRIKVQNTRTLRNSWIYAYRISS